MLGTNVFPESDAPRYVKGQSICAAFIFFNGLLAFGLRTLLVWKNKKLDKKYALQVGPGEIETAQSEVKESAVAEENYGPTYRYIL